ncbi:DciA family protein [Streptomyces sp. NEAU-H3]|uniref:DciA family protein n=1 Tax=Streptomyces sp. NEAU-H3 TaxID=2720636 RepID=UPI00143AA351|nr:DUF721 domain-containing protein [Streptomyces sp. NEAU-H3]NJA56714.1 DUF721 domain-containing protein [Streptomyces sp. NEAU-H3]
MTTPSSGADLARQALRAYKAAAPATGPTKTTPKRRRYQRGNGRDPIALGAALQTVTTAEGWDKGGLTGGDIISQWPSLCPQFADGQVTPISYDPATGRLTLRPANPSWGAHLRLLGGQLAKQINDKLGTDAVRTLRVLAPGTAARPGPDAYTAVNAEPTTAAPAADPRPVKTRETASAGYKAALAAHQQHAVSNHAERAADAQARATVSTWTRETDPAAVTTLPDPRAEQEIIRQQAIARARATRAGAQPTTAFQQTA